MKNLLAAVTLVGLLNTTTLAQRPTPIGTSRVTVSYETTSGPVSFSGDRDYLGNAMGPGNATILDAASNVKAFNSVNSFGRRTFLANSNPMFADVLAGDESLIAHAFFKIDNIDDFFPGIVQDGVVTITIDQVSFDQPVTVDRNTVMLHSLWNAQADQLDPPYISLHNHNTQTTQFRDFSDFIAGGVFGDFPSPNYALGVLSPVVSGQGSDTLRITARIPYALLKHLEDQGQSVPAGLPAPQGFLEPFHFHVEYAVAPAQVSVVPTASQWSYALMTLILLTTSACVLCGKATSSQPINH